MSRLQTIDLTTFTGGLNRRASAFQLAQSESPDILNMEIDPRGGFFTRKGWERWNAADITDPVDWDPRSSELLPLSDGNFQLYVANGSTVWASGTDGVFANLGIPVGGSSHLADFASWGDTAYIACGSANVPYRRQGTGTAIPLTPAGSGSWNNDYTVVDGGVMPQAEHVEPHASYLFTAVSNEDGTTYDDRLRWSHPNQPEDWAELDYIDIKTGGGVITGLMSYQDHLLIFKTDSLWALYGYDAESWQLIKVSRSIGAPTPNAVARSEDAVFFYSSASHSAIYAYTGDSPVEISHQLDPVLEDVTLPQDVWLGWVGNRLWCSLPYDELARTGEGSQFIFDPSIGNGAWTRHKAAVGEVTCIVEGSDIDTGSPLACLSGSSGVSCLVKLDYLDRAVDSVDVAQTTPVPFETRYRTGWMFDGEPDRRKSWRRPRFIVRRGSEEVRVQVDTFWNYNQQTAKRSHTLILDTDASGAFWRLTGPAEERGFDWGDGSLWNGAIVTGGQIERAQPPAGGQTGLGVARAVQLRFTTASSTPGQPWGVEAIVLKYINRRMTT